MKVLGRGYVLVLELPSEAYVLTRLIKEKVAFKSFAWQCKGNIRTVVVLEELPEWVKEGEA